jgi:hypothetical protein
MNYITTAPATTASTSNRIAVNDRKFALTNPPATAPKSKQQQIILTIMSEANEPMTPVEISALWDKHFLSINTPKDGTLNSVRYHLNAMTKAGLTSTK